jgi:transposase
MSLKKNLVIEKNGLIYFFDESRFGTHSKIGHGWFKTGERTGVKIKLGFKNFYLYSAVNPISGDNFTLRMPKVNTECMNVFLAEFSKEIGEARATIIMDGASWHKSKNLIIPNNITITILPPYCPELNPVERLWLYIKQNTIKNKIYDNISILDDVVCDFIKNLKIEQVKHLCNYSY